MKRNITEMSTKPIDIDERGERGRQNFLGGLNCTQSVVAAFSDLFPDDDPLTLLRMAASFGGGMGRLRLTCGAVTGLAMLAGLENGPTTGDMAARTRNYALVQRLAEEFKRENDSLICSELLGLRTGAVEPPRPSDRTTEYYKARPCPRLIECACRIYARHLNEDNSPSLADNQS